MITIAIVMMIIIIIVMIILTIIMVEVCLTYNLTSTIHYHSKVIKKAKTLVKRN